MKVLLSIAIAVIKEIYLNNSGALQFKHGRNVALLSE